MSKVVFILGAGASRQCGAPLMYDFLDTASNLLVARSVDDKRMEFEKVFRAIGALQAVHSKAQLDLNNIESIFTVLELGRIIQKVPGLAIADIGPTIAALKELIVKTLEVTMKFPVRDRTFRAPAPYDEFGKLIRYLMLKAAPKQSSSVVSFNYDIAADLALHRAGLGPDYIIEKPDSNSGHVQLMKLHGSLNWATETETRKIRPIHLQNYFLRYSVSSFDDSPREISIPIGSQLVEFFRPVTVDSEPVIVPPSWNKADYHAALSDVWAAAARNLSEAEQIYIIGYSLPETDSFFRHLYALGSVGDAPLRRIAIYNPDESGATDMRFRALLGPGATARYEYHAMTFAKAIAHIKKNFPGDPE